MAVGTIETVGRDNEIAAISDFLRESKGTTAVLLLEGDAGIGKTTLWSEAIRAAEGHGYRVLSASASQAEARMSFAALGDIMSDVLPEVIGDLPPPQRRALEVALLISAVEGPPPDPRTTGVAALASFRKLAQAGPVLVAVDDVQWLDGPSATTLAFALRRLRADAVGFLLARRTDGGSALPLGLDRQQTTLERVEVGPLSLGGLHRLLSVHLGATFSRPLLRRLHQMVGGNPFFALEVARALERRGGRLDPGEPLPVPSSLNDLLEERLGTLSPETEDALLVAAALHEPTPELIALALADGDVWARLEPAIRAHVVEADDARVRFSHPLLSSAVYSRANPDRRRELHRRLAAIPLPVEERARHLALSSETRNGEVAATLEEAARHAAARGAPAAAAEFAELAAQRTPEDSVDDVHRRRLAASEHHFTAGEVVRARAILTELVETLPPGPLRARALLRLSRAEGEDWNRAMQLATQAISEAGTDLALIAHTRYWQSFAWVVRGDIRGSRAHARAAVGSAEEAGDPVALVQSLAHSFLLDMFAGVPLDRQLVERALVLEASLEGVPLHYPPSLTLGLRDMYVGRLDDGRRRMESARQRAVDIGDDFMLGGILLHLAELECRAGDWPLAARHAEAGYQVTLEMGLDQHQGSLLCAKALVAAHQGFVEDARHAASECGHRTPGADIRGRMSRAVLGFVQLSLGDVIEAARILRPVCAELRSLGFAEPSITIAPPNLVEVHVELGELDDARGLLDEMERVAAVLGSTWTLAQVWRGRGLVAAANGDLDASFVAFAQALAEHDQMPAPFERARTLLALGKVQRRAKQKRAARESLETALAIFEELGARLWAKKTRAEVGRIGGRAATGGLTPTERRIAELVAEGRSNKEVAAALFVTVKTVEHNLTRIYAKLGVRSRTELARRFAEGGVGSRTP